MGTCLNKQYVPIRYLSFSYQYVSCNYLVSAKFDSSSIYLLVCLIQEGTYLQLGRLNVAVCYLCPIFRGKYAQLAYS